MENKQDLIEEIKRGEISSEIPNEDLSSDSKKREDKFNKKLYVANKLRQLGAAVAMTASTIGGANAQENNSAEGLPRDVNANTIELPINKEAVEPHLSEIKYYNYYKYLSDQGLSDEVLEYWEQRGKATELWYDMEKMGYAEAKEAAKHICAYPRYEVCRRVEGAQLDDLRGSLMNCKGHPDLIYGKDYDLISNIRDTYVIPLTDEYKERLQGVANAEVATLYWLQDKEVTTKLLKCISNDSTLTDEAKDSLMRKEINYYFSAIDSGRYDVMIARGRREVDEALYIKNRTNWKSYMLESLSKINPSLAEELRTQYSIPARKKKNRTITAPKEIARRNAIEK